MGKRGKKVNPNRRPASQADIKRAKEKAKHDALVGTWAIFFSVMRDKEGYDTESLCRLWKEVNDRSEGIAQGYISIHDLIRSLAEEDGIRLEEYQL